MKRKIKTYVVSIECNGGEYVCNHVIKAPVAIQTGDRSIKAGNVEIIFDEQIISFEEGDNNEEKN